jgi:hypothetical protein
MVLWYLFFYTTSHLISRGLPVQLNVATFLKQLRSLTHPFYTIFVLLSNAPKTLNNSLTIVCSAHNTGEQRGGLSTILRFDPVALCVFGHAIVIVPKGTVQGVWAGNGALKSTGVYTEYASGNQA